MALCWVKAGECEQETTIEVRKINPTDVVCDIITTCEHIQAVADELGEINVGDEMSRPMNETIVYMLAAKHCCRNSCVVPAAILKTIEATAGIFLPVNCQMEFMEGAI